MTTRTKQNLLDLYPLTPLQQGILFHALASDRDDPYLVRLCFRIEGAVDVDALRRAWQTAIDRHEALRADLEWVKSKQPIALVFRQCPVDLVEIDASHQADTDAALDARLRAIIADESGRYSLARAADQRVVLVRAGASRSFLIWIFHHTLLDGWSLANVLGEVLGAYQAHVAGAPPELPAVPAYATYLAWLRAQEAPAAAAYWRGQLAGLQPPTFPPAAHFTDLGAEHGFAERSISFDEATSAQLRALAASAGVTLSTCFQAAHALLIKAYTGADDVVFGATVAGRPAELAAASAMVGAFINTVPVRAKIASRAPVVAWLAELHRAAGTRGAFEHLGLPKIQELAALPAATPVFESILVFENFPVTEVLAQSEAMPFAVEIHRLHGEADGVTVGRGRNNYPLTVVVLPGKRIEMIVAYHRARVADTTAHAMLDQLARTVRGLAAASPATTIADLNAPVAGAPIAAPVAAPIAPFRAIHDQITHWATATPDALAVRCDDATLTFAQLAARADQLAHALRDRGVGPGDRVGICLPRSLDFIVALQATLALGAAYVPVEPGHPRARLGELFGDAELAAVVTRRAQLATLDDLHPTLVTVDDLANTSARPIATNVHPETPAYLIFTSGSTGRPKGVVVSHRALANYVAAVLDRLALPAAASFAMISTVAADLGHTALFGALCNGGALHMISDERASDPDGFAAYMTRHQIAALKIVPGHLWGLMQIAEPDRALPAHTLVIGGEAAPPPLLAHLRAQRKCRVVNHYGPTETTVGILTHAVDAASPDPLPLGHPIAGNRAYVLGPDLSPLPTGGVGEIFLAGRNLSAGYFRRGALTAERFIPDPYGAPGARMYRTGDRGRLRGDGAIDFLGRADDQIKIRGFRVELGEVRAELLRATGADDARAVVRPGPAGAPQLCAYLIGTPIAELDTAIRARLPEHMVPAAYVWLDRFPLTANGKIDLARLPAPDAVASTGRAIRPPVSDAERALAAIWREILSCDEVSLDDNFFQLGGDSILALKVVARAKRAGWKLSPKQLHNAPTLGEAARIATPITAAAPTAAAAPTSAPSTIQLTPIQHRFLAEQKLDPHHYNQAILLELTAPLDLDRLTRALTAITAHHAALRLRFTREGTVWRATCAAADAPLPDLVTRVDLTAASDHAAAIDRACEELQRSFDLARGPLLRASFLDLGAAGARLLLFAHHLVVDGVSWRLLLEDLAQLVRDPDSALPAPTTPFADWAAALHRYAASPGLRDQLPHWQRVAGAAPPPPTGSVGDSAIVTAELDDALTAALLTRAPRAYDTRVNDLLLVALGRALAAAPTPLPGVISVEGHGRDDIFDGLDLSRTVGWFSTTYPLRITGNPNDLAATIIAIRDQRRALPDHGLGFDVLRTLGHAALPADAAVTFNYLGQFDQTFAGQATFRVAGEGSGRRRSPHTPRPSRFVVNAVVYDGALRVDWEYNQRIDDRAAVADLLAAFVRELRTVVAHCETIAGAPPT